MPATTASEGCGRTRTFPLSRWPGSTSGFFWWSSSSGRPMSFWTRPIFHKFTATICGHIFVSFLALLVLHELEKRLKRKGLKLERRDILRDLLEVREVEVAHGGKWYILRTPLKGVAGKAFQAVGVTPPPTAREANRGAKTDVQAP